MQITDIRIRKIAKEGKMKAVVSVTFDNAFVVHDIKVIDGEKGLFIAMPSRKASDGEYRDIAHPINSDTRDIIQKSILQEYEAIMASGEEETIGEAKAATLQFYNNCAIVAYPMRQMQQNLESKGFIYVRFRHIQSLFSMCDLCYTELSGLNSASICLKNTLPELTHIKKMYLKQKDKVFCDTCYNNPINKIQ